MSASQRLPILFQDDDFVAVDKPAGLIVIPGRDDAVSLIELMRAQMSQQLLLVHRIDKDTSGVLLLARHSAAQRHASRQFQSNSVSKQYLALVSGRPAEGSGIIDAPLGTHPRSAKRMAVVKHGGRPAVTEWKIERSFRHHTLLRVFPKTGKTHQIRVHLAHIGLPLAIDELYNSASQALLLSAFKRDYRAGAEAEKPLMQRLTLHAERLSFSALGGGGIELTAPLPKDFRAALNMLGKYSSG